MTTNQTIDGVPRELLEIVAGFVSSQADAFPKINIPHGMRSDALDQITAELRALLDAAGLKPFTSADGERCGQYRIEGSTVYIDGFTGVRPASELLTGLPMKPGDYTFFNQGYPPETIRVSEQPTAVSMFYVGDIDGHGCLYTEAQDGALTLYARLDEVTRLNTK